MHVHLGLQIVIFGRSLGGAVAFWVAAANPGLVNSLIVENTFWSIEAVVGKVNCHLDLPCGTSRPDDKIALAYQSTASGRALAALPYFMYMCLPHFGRAPERAPDSCDCAHQMPEYRMPKQTRCRLCRSHLHMKRKSSIHTCQQWHSHIWGTQANLHAASIDKKACLCCQYSIGQVQFWVLSDADHSRLSTSCLIYQEED